MKVSRLPLSASIGLLAVLVCSSASAQFFGPQSFEDCMLEKMKGQAPNMAGIARTACRKQFPQEVPLTESEVTSIWCDTSDNTISACAVVKPEYKVTRAEVTFTRAKCGTPESNFFQPDLNVSVAPPMFGSTYKFSVNNARLYQCARFIFYGYKKN